MTGFLPASTVTRITYDQAKKCYTPWTARWYQVLALRDDSRKKVYRQGRRTGKTETMCIEALWNVNTHKEFVFVFCAPYENQIRLIFNRLHELINGSPLLKKRVVSSTKSPYEIRFQDNSRIVGFTTSANSGNGGASIRGQRANMIAVDEMDYLGESDFENISMLAAEREDIRIVVSSTPTGARKAFYKVCTDKRMGYSEHYVPSTMNPNWSDKMEAEFRAELTELGYIHEVLADFGPQDTGVFNKDCVDQARQFDNYAYNELTQAQLLRLENIGGELPMMYFPMNGKFKPNLFRCMGVDFDKYQASSSILILDFDADINKFRVVLRYELPKSEYSYDAALNAIVSLNRVYNPSWIYCDRGSGEYIIERLHIIGEQDPASGLKNKVKGFHFKNKLTIMDPVTKENHDEPMKPFMINQLALAFERHRLILSPYDDVLYTQLINYSVERISQAGLPVYTSKEEHYVDALGLAMLAFVLEFPKITKTIKEIENTSKLVHIDTGFQAKRAQLDLESMMHNARSNSPWDVQHDPTELRGDRQVYYKVPNGTPLGAGKAGSGMGWGSRRAARITPATRKIW